jgi:hypothetical protein
MSIGQVHGSHPQSRQSAKLFFSRQNWDSPNPSPAGGCALPQFWGEGYTRWREKGWESPNSDEGSYTVLQYSLYLRTLWSHPILRPLPLCLPSASTSRHGTYGTPWARLLLPAFAMVTLGGESCRNLHNLNGIASSLVRAPNS